MYRNLLLILLLLPGYSAFTQSVKIFGKVTNAKQEPLAFASVQVKEYKHGSITKEDGSYELELEEGKYDLVISMVGYKLQVITIIVRKTGYRQDIIMEAADPTSLLEVTVKGKYKDRAEEYIRNVIRSKEGIEAAAGAYSCNVYIKAVQEDSMALQKPKKTIQTDSLRKVLQANAELNRMALAEIVLRLDRESARRVKEERTGITKKGNAATLFFLSTTEGDFNFYNNLVSVPAISQTPFLSPLSYSGLLAYRYKTLKTETVNGQKIYTIGIKPRQLSNATVEGEIIVADGTWVVLHTKLRLPKYHLAEYDFFEVEQQYELVNGKAWMITRQELTYNAMSGKRKSSGRTIVTYRDFELNKTFDKKYFGTEISAAAQQAYERDSSFWQANRTEPLTEKELRFIHYKDSIFRATHTKAYLDSIDKVTNTITWQNILFKGQVFNDHEKQRRWYLPALPALYNPVQFGGARIQGSFMYSKTFKSRKNINIYSEISYGLRNKDINGNIRLNKMYNPFNRGFYSVSLEKNFEYIFSGD
ncbi:MAG: carboxypeptidase-like regulatory domain-containing protein, partial [Ferruginibacter sp.]|nr:carboxypeptidase-like regulatory domain-containing protein [Chitinophagaceae bacterium]